MIFKTNNDNTSIITFLQARKLAEQELSATIQQKQAILATDEAALRLYEIEVAKGTVSTERFATIMRGASFEAQNYAVSTKGATGSTQVFVSNQQKTIDALKNIKKASISASVGMKALNIALNMGAMLAFSLAVKAVTWAIDTAITTLEEQKEKVEECASAYETAQSELSSITSELESQTKVMNDLLAKDKLSYAEKGQLEELQQITKELQLQKDIADRKEGKSQKDLAVESAELVNKQYGKETSTKEKVDEYEHNADLTGNNAILVSDENNLSAMIAGYRQFNELLSEAYSSKNEDDIEHFKSLIDDVSESIWNTVSSLQEQQANMKDYYNTIKDTPYAQLTSEQRSVIDAYQKTANEIKLIYSELDQNAWNDIEVSNILNVDGIEKTKDELISMAKAGELTPETITDYSNLNNAIKDSEIFLKNGQTAAQAFCDEIYACAEAKDNLETDVPDEPPVHSISSTIDQLNTQLKPAFDSLKSAYQEIFTFDDDGKEVFSLSKVDLSSLGSIKSAIDDLNEDGLKIDYSSFENFVRVLTNSSSTADQVKNAFNDLTTSFLYGTDALENLNHNTINTVTAMLESLGVANAEEIAYAALATNTEVLALQKQYLAETGNELAAVSSLNVQWFLNEAGASDTARAALFQLAATEQVYNQTDLNVEGKIAKLEALALQYGQTAIAARIAAMEEQAEASRAPLNERDYQNIASEIQNSINSVKIDFKGISDKSKAGKAGKETADAYKEAFEKELKDLQYLRDIGAINEKEYLDRLRSLNRRYFADKKKYLDEYRQYEKEFYEGSIAMYEKVIGLVGRQIDRQVQDLNKQKDVFDKQKDALEEQKDLLEKQKEIIKEHYESQIDAVQDQIDAINKEKDALQEANDERKRALELQKAEYELKRAQEQKTDFIYGQGQFGYVTNTDNEREARNKIEDIKFENTIAEYDKSVKLLEEQIDSLQKEMDEATEAIDRQIDAIDKQIDGIDRQISAVDNQINSLQEYKEAWSNIPQDVEDAQLALLAAQILGADWETQILSGRLQTLAQFKQQYEQLFVDMANILNGAVGGAVVQPSISGSSSSTSNVSGESGSSSSLPATQGINKEINGSIFNLPPLQSSEFEESLQNVLVKLKEFKTQWQEAWTDVLNIVETATGVGGGSDSGTGDSKGKPSGKKDGNAKKSEESASGIIGALTEAGELIDEILNTDWMNAFDQFTFSGETSIEYYCNEIQRLVQEMVDNVVRACEEAMASIRKLSSMEGVGLSVPHGGGGISTLPKHANGVKNLSHSELAWTNEEGPEMIISPTYGAVLTPLKPGDSVLTKSFTENLFDWGAVNPTNFAKNLINNTDLPVIERKTNVEVHQDVNINCPNVTNNSGIDYINRHIQNLPLRAYQESFKIRSNW